MPTGPGKGMGAETKYILSFFRNKKAHLNIFIKILFAGQANGH